MALQLDSVSTVATAIVIFISAVILRYLRSWPLSNIHSRDKAGHGSVHKSDWFKELRLTRKLASALPDCTILPCDLIAFKKATSDFYWAQQESEVIPACVIRPRNVEEISVAVQILKREYDKLEIKSGDVGARRGLFAIRSGGHSPIPGAASMEQGVVIDLGHFCEVIPSQNEPTVTIGAGARWGDVSQALEDNRLAVVGGRNSAVGVGGFTLGGGLSFLSPRFGFACSNVISYEIVLASGSVVLASSSANQDLWKALKGGSNNFGIVTRFVVHSFPSAKIWSCFIYMPSFQSSKVLAAFYGSVNSLAAAYDVDAAGPITCFSYIKAIGIQAISVNLVHTKPSQNESQWPSSWKNSSFASLWRYWSTCRIRSLTGATNEMSALNPPGRRQVFATTTIKNDLATLAAAHGAYSEAVNLIRSVRIRGLVWTLVLQPLLPHWIRKGHTNPLNLYDCTEPLVLVSFTVSWSDDCNDEFVKATTRTAVEKIDDFAAVNKTNRYLNYCAEWQKPFEGYGNENWHFLQKVARTYDPDCSRKHAWVDSSLTLLITYMAPISK